ncbi:hypothetical protein ACFZAD_21165 [Streptomyces iakyrus]|uniref:hypothetical protein n=1 Tax=Streptomyces iakyrus TaxID=68219 RepID=UPI0036EF6010
MISGRRGNADGSSHQGCGDGAGTVVDVEFGVDAEQGRSVRAACRMPDVKPNGANARDLQYFVELYGFTPAEALRAALSTVAGWGAWERNWA